MVIGYVVDGNDNDSTMYHSDDPSLPTCSKCGFLIDFNYVSSNFKLKVKKYDISASYDNVTIVSRRFMDFCLTNNYNGLRFTETDRGFFVLQVSNIVQYDITRSVPKCYKLCEACGNYETVNPTLPLKLSVIEPLADGFYATDILFSSYNGKKPFFIVGAETYTKLKAEKFRGINLMAVSD